MRFKISSYFEHTFFSAALLQKGCWLWFAGSRGFWKGWCRFPPFHGTISVRTKGAKDNAAPAKTQTPRKFFPSKGSTVGKWSHAGHWKLAGCRLVLVACGSLCSVHPLVIYVVAACEASPEGSSADDVWLDTCWLDRVLVPESRTFDFVAHNLWLCQWSWRFVPTRIAVHD